MHNFKILYRKSLGGHACLQFRSYATRKTHYQVLGVKKTATQQEIKNAYIQLSKKHHPDTAGSGSKQTFTEINEAYSVLSKPLSRKEYDNQLAFSAAQNASSSYYRPHRGPQGSRPAGYPNDQYQQRQNERTYQSQESSTYSDFHRKRPPRRTKWDLFPLETKVMAALLVIITLIKVIGWAVTQIPRSCTPIIRHKTYKLARKWSAEIFHGVIITYYLILILLYGRMRIEMYAQSELHGKYYDFYERYEREQGESAKGKNGLTANFIVMAGLLFALMISITRFTLGMMLNADPHLQRSPSDEVKRKMDRETRERHRAMEIEKDITPPKA